MAYIDFIYDFFGLFGNALQTFFDWMNKPMLKSWAIELLDQLPPGVLDFFGISSFSEFTYLWALGAGFIVICAWIVLTWLLNILP